MILGSWIKEKTNLLEDENRGVFDRLRSEKVVRLEINSTFFHRFRDFFRPQLQLRYQKSMLYKNKKGGK